MAEDNLITSRTCRVCHGVFLATPEFFCKHKNGKFGLDSMCKDCTRAKNAEYHKKNKAAINFRQRQYSQTEEYKEKNAVRRREYRVTNVKNNIYNRTQCMVRSCLRDRGIKKNESLEALLGYSIDDLVNHIELQFTSGMNWDVFMTGAIHLDHIVPVASFDITSQHCAEFKACWALGNLRPMWSTDNRVKGDRRTFLL